MWLDAFKPKTGNMQKIGVPGVPGVPPSSKPSVYAGSAEVPARYTVKNQGVPGVPEAAHDTPGTPRYTMTKTGYAGTTPPCKACIHAGLAIPGTPGTPDTPQKHVKPKIRAKVGESESHPIDLVREFMDVNGLTLADAQALAAVAVQPRPAGEWLALIAELDALIERYCAASGLTGAAKAAIFATRCAQSLASIPESLAWFRHEVALLTASKLNRACVLSLRVIAESAGISHQGIAKVPRH
jgi:hypothetical protein